MKVKAKCINAEGQRILKLGEIYTITGGHSIIGKPERERVWIEEHKRFMFLKSRFEVIVGEI